MMKTFSCISGTKTAWPWKSGIIATVTKSIPNLFQTQLGKKNIAIISTMPLSILFAENFVRPRIIEKRELFYLKDLLAMFIKYVKQVENVDASSYQTNRLKKRLTNVFPMLRFHTSSHVTKSQIVYVEDLTAGEVIDCKMDVATASMDETDASESEDERFAVRSNILSPLYNIAMYLKEVIKNAKGIDEGVWPPVSANLTTQAACSSVATELFNFIAWITGCSSDPELEKKVEILGEMEPKVLALAQDLIHISSKGKTQTHKSLTLGMAVRQMTRSKKLIDILNGFGHCVSSTTVINHETALAIVNSKDSVEFPVGVIPKRFTTFVYDNADFNEDTLSGKGTTHVANSICIQRSDHYDTTAIDTPTISKKIRRLDAPSDCLEEFHLGKRRVSQVKAHCDTVQIESGISESADRARELDFFYIICKIIVGGHNVTFSNWI